MVQRATYEQNMIMLVLIFSCPYFVIDSIKFVCVCVYVCMCKRILFYNYFNFNNSIIIYSQVNEAELHWSLILINFLGLTMLENYAKISVSSFKSESQTFLWFLV